MVKTSVIIMEKKLKRLFDYQKFENNPRLEAMLSEAEGRYEGGLSDEDMELVSAAGDPVRILPIIIMDQENNQ